MQPAIRKIATTSLSLGILVASARAGGVRIVEPTGTQNFADIQAAVDAAASGDVILVGAGIYGAVSVGNKSISVFAVPGATVNVGSILVSSLAADQSVVFSGMRSGPVVVQNSSGHVRFQDCQITAPDYDFVDCPLVPRDGVPGARVILSTRTAFHGCRLQGGKGEGADGSVASCSVSVGTEGGAGLEATGSSIVLYDCELTGGEGGGLAFTPGPGGPGAELSTTQILASNCAFLGGRGGDNYFLCGCPQACTGDGGPGVRHTSGTFHEIGSSFQGAWGHEPSGGAGCQPLLAPPVAGGPVNSMAGPARTATVTPTVQSDASTWSIAYQGAPGDRPLLFASLLPQFLISVPFHGAWLTKRNSLLIAANLGQVNGAGALNRSVPAPNLPAGSLVRRQFAQVPARATVGVYVGSPAVLLLLDRDSGPDCNGNGVSDLLDVIEGVSADANHNLIPDTCPGG